VQECSELIKMLGCCLLTYVGPMNHILVRDPDSPTGKGFMWIFPHIADHHSEWPVMLVFPAHGPDWLDAVLMQSGFT